VGRHTAPDGGAVHPVVAEALARRPVDAVGAHRGESTQRIGTSVGWPGRPPEPGTGGLGWPGDLAPSAPVGVTTDGDGAAENEAEDPAPAMEDRRRRGWRRIFGLDRAA
jgi:hypothetical protein